MDLTGKTYLVTGGTGFLGSAVVERLLGAGADVHVTWFYEQELDDFAFTEEVTLQKANLAEEADVSSLFSSIEGLFGSIHTAGGFSFGNVEDISLADFTAMWSLNAATTFLCCREAIQAIRRAGGGGRIVNIAARPALEPTGGMIAYTTSKAAVASMTQCLAQEVLAEGILINAVAPSLFDTPTNRDAMPEADFDIWPKAEEIAEVVVALASPVTAVTSGSVVPVYGRV